MWIAVDWGTTNLRLWVMDETGAVIASHRSPKGMSALGPTDFEPALLELIQPYLSDDTVLPVVCCGMVGAVQGWADAGYTSVPCSPPDGRSAKPVPSNDTRISVQILSGLKQISPADVMRGEETQVAGFLRLTPDFDGVICLPGTHSKWVHISAGEVVSFQTFMTGEMFDLLSTQSVLRHSVHADGLDAASFEMAIDDVISRPQVLASHLFRLRAGGLVGDQTPDQARGRLSGLLIGAELAGARPYWLGQNVAIIGAGTLARLYQTGLGFQGVQAKCYDVSEMTQSGLTAAYQSLTKDT